MKTYSCSFFIFKSIVIALIISMNALAQQKPPAGRTGIDPSSRNQVAVVQSRARIEGDKANLQVTKSVVSSPLGKNCSTSIGNAAKEPSVGQTSSKYGPGSNSDQIVIVKGSVINICK